MIQGYEKPTLEFERYELSTSIATGCGKVVNLGPEDGTYNGTFYTACSDYTQETFDAENPAILNFFEGRCSCYLSSGDVTIFTS